MWPPNPRQHCILDSKVFRKPICLQLSMNCYLYAHHTLYIALHSWVIAMALNHFKKKLGYTSRSGMLHNCCISTLGASNSWIEAWCAEVEKSLGWFQRNCAAFGALVLPFKDMSCLQFPLPLNFFLRIWDLRSAVLGFIIGAFSTSAFYQGLVSNLVLCRFNMPRICCTIEHMRTGKTHESHIQNCNSGHFERPGAQASSFLCNCWLSLTCFACNSSHWGWFPVKMVRGLGDGLWHWLYRFTTFMVVVSKPWALISLGGHLCATLHDCRDRG